MSHRTTSSGPLYPPALRPRSAGEDRQEGLELALSSGIAERAGRVRVRGSAGLIGECGRGVRELIKRR